MTEKRTAVKEYCQSCGAVLHGKFCSECGEKKFDRSDLSFKKIILQGIDVFTHFDSKIFASVKLLVTKPGLLSVQYCKGVKVKYAKPIQLFFLINVLYFIFVSFGTFNTFNTPLYVHMNATTHRELANSMVEHKLDKKDLDSAQYNSKLADYSKVFDTKVNILSKSLIIIIVPILALVLLLLFYNSKRLYTEDLIFSLNFLSWFLLFKVVFLDVLILLLSYLGKLLHFNARAVLTDDSVSFFLFIIIGIYSYYAVNRFYGGKKWLNILRCIALPYIFLNVVYLYRFILFIITFYST